MFPRTTIWRLRHRTGDVAECVIRERLDGRSSLCVIGGTQPSVEVFDRSTMAMRRALVIEEALIAAGWREEGRKSASV